MTFCTDMLFCAKNIERMGDHATNSGDRLLNRAGKRAQRGGSQSGCHQQGSAAVAFVIGRTSCTSDLGDTGSLLRLRIERLRRCTHELDNMASAWP